MSPFRKIRVFAGFLFVLFVLGCAIRTPVGVDLVSAKEAYQYSQANPLSQGVLSDDAKFVLYRHFLLEKFEREPSAGISDLHDLALKDDRRDILYTLAEMSYLYACELGNSYSSKKKEAAFSYFLLSALYAHYFSFDKNNTLSFSYSRSERNAIDLYNYSLLQALYKKSSKNLNLQSSEHLLPFGKAKIEIDSSRLPLPINAFENFLPSDQYLPRGVSVRNRSNGAGIPIIGVGAKAENMISTPVFPMTAFLRVNGGIQDLKKGTVKATIELYPASESNTIEIGKRKLPLATDSTAPLAYAVEGSDLFDLNLDVFLGKTQSKLSDGLYMKDNFHPEKIPVVLVHGTASSPVWWVEMLNTLMSDPKIRSKYQFWYFVYSSNKGVPFSAADLRDALTEKTRILDPERSNSFLKQMVIIGHSQGGLLTKLTAVDSGDLLVKAITGKNFDKIKLPKESRARLERLLVIKPLPFVKTVIFMSTPHRGSYLSKDWVRNLFRSFVTLPKNVLQVSKEYLEYMSDDVKRAMGINGTEIFTSADSMSPKNPLIQTLAEISLSPSIVGHSIIAVLPDEENGDPKKGNDGVVEYSSAHLEGMKSEFIVRGGHSSQLNPLAIDEVRRILIENLSTSRYLGVKN